MSRWPSGQRRQTQVREFWSTNGMWTWVQIPLLTAFDSIPTIITHLPLYGRFTSVHEITQKLKILHIANPTVQSQRKDIRHFFKVHRTQLWSIKILQTIQFCSVRCHYNSIRVMILSRSELFKAIHLLGQRSLVPKTSFRQVQLQVLGRETC